MLSSIENGTFDKFITLKRLILDSNKLTNMDEGILSEQVGSTLLKLDLRDNNLQTISLKNMRNLEKLELDRNNRLKFYNEIDGKNVTIFSKALSNLKTLTLTSCQISALEDDVFENLM